VIGGTIHAADAVALQAQNGVTTAYNFLAGQACGTDLTGQDLGGLTLTPGVYCFSSSAQLTGTLTLDGPGIYVFQIGTSLTTASGSAVALINGASACNVWWQVGSSATLGTAASLPGSVLALTSITLNTAANVSGRALARNGAVTLDGNAVTVCAAGPGVVQIPTLSEWGLIMLMALLGLVGVAMMRIRSVPARSFYVRRAGSKHASWRR
jgi:type VI secretion system secreted protein VgrG